MGLGTSDRELKWRRNSFFIRHFRKVPSKILKQKIPPKRARCFRERDFNSLPQPWCHPCQQQLDYRSCTNCSIKPSFALICFCVHINPPQKRSEMNTLTKTELHSPPPPYPMQRAIRYLMNSVSCHWGLKFCCLCSWHGVHVGRLSLVLNVLLNARVERRNMFAF